jgi:ATP-dependent protease ClpP protease subunit
VAATCALVVAPIAEMQLPRIVWDQPRPKGIAYPGGFIPPGQVATGAQVVAALRDFKARGCVGLVLTVDSLGGEASACTAVFDAIRDFSRHAGPVAAFVSGHAVSSAVHWALAADLVVMAPGATYQVHAAVPFDGDLAAEAELYASDACQRMNEWQATTIRARSAETPAIVAQALARAIPKQRLQLPANVAVHFGWADAIGDAGVAWGLLTALLERGEAPRSRRRRFLVGERLGPASAPGAPGVAMVGIAEDGVTVVDLSGGTTVGNFSALTANNAAATGWVELNGYVQGRAASGTALGTLAAHGKLHSNARYVRLAVTFNSAAGDGVQDLDALELDVVTAAAAIEDGAVTISKIATDSLRTTNYAEDGSGNATAGAKLDHQGTALKVAPGNLQIGAYTFANVMRLYTFTTSGTSNSATITIGGTEPDTNYGVFVAPLSISGATPPVDALAVLAIGKGTIYVTVQTRGAPGTGVTITWQAVLIRLP